MRTLKYNGVNKFGCTCFYLLENDREIGYVELIKDFGVNKHINYKNLINFSEAIVTLLKS